MFTSASLLYFSAWTYMDVSSIFNYGRRLRDFGRRSLNISFPQAMPSRRLMQQYVFPAPLYPPYPDSHTEAPYSPRKMSTYIFHNLIRISNYSILNKNPMLLTVVKYNLFFFNQFIFKYMILLQNFSQSRIQPLKVTCLKRFKFIF